MNTQQLDLFSVLEDRKVQVDIYYNGLGQPLPWEDPEYISLHTVVIKGSNRNT